MNKIKPKNYVQHFRKKESFTILTLMVVVYTYVVLPLTQPLALIFSLQTDSLQRHQTYAAISMPNVYVATKPPQFRGSKNKHNKTEIKPTATYTTTSNSASSSSTTTIVPSSTTTTTEACPDDCVV